MINSQHELNPPICDKPKLRTANNFSISFLNMVLVLFVQTSIFIHALKFFDYFVAQDDKSVATSKYFR